MAHPQINHSSDPIRLFKSPFLEFFTHISPVTITAIWLPVAILFIVLGWLHTAPAERWYTLPSGFMVGLFVWTLTEYTLHRFLFHFPAKTALQHRISFLFHGVHHAQPQCKTRLVMPPVVSIPLAAVFYGLFLGIFSLIGAVSWLYPFMTGFLIGYLIYDLTHYATHHFPMRSGYLKYIKRYHMQHHYKTPNARYGVSSPLWDIVFKTKPSE
ncbi:MAG TPA: sterol desaturase family protein [Anaerolineaceae bacterium]